VPRSVRGFYGVSLWWRRMPNEKLKTSSKSARQTTICEHCGVRYSVTFDQCAIYRQTCSFSRKQCTVTLDVQNKEFRSRRRSANGNKCKYSGTNAKIISSGKCLSTCATGPRVDQLCGGGSPEHASRRVTEETTASGSCEDVRTYTYTHTHTHTHTQLRLLLPRPSF
jgi:hypothetical protein